MLYLKQSTASQSVIIGPFVDKTDGNSQEVSLTIANTDIRLSKNGGNLAAKNSGGGTHDEEGFYQITLDATDTDTVGRLQLFCHIEADALPVYHEFMVLEETVYDGLFATNSGATTLLPVDTLAVGGTTQTAGDIPALVTAVDTVVDGIQTDLDNGTDGLGAIKADTAAILTDTGTSGVLLAATATSAQLVDDVWDEALTGASHNVATSSGRRLRQIQESGSVYSEGAVWIDTVNGTAGTVSYENGTTDNPVDNIADANTIAAAVGLSRFRVAPGSSITFAADQTDKEFLGHDWTLNLGSRNVSGSFIEGATLAASTMTAASGGTVFYQCVFDNNVTLAPCIIRESYFGNVTITAGSAGSFYSNLCMSRVAGSGTPTFDFGAALNASNLSMRHYSGGITIANMGAGTGTYELSLEGQGQLIVAASCSATSNASVRGAFDITDNAGGAVTITQTANYTAANVNAEADTAISDAGLATAAALTTVDTVVDAIKAKTDSLTFTTANQVDSNVQSVNDVGVAGTGAVGDEWGPV